MHSIEVVLVMLLAVLASGYLVRILPFSLPLPLMQIGLGAAIVSVSGQGVPLNPEIFFLLFLPPLLFLDGWRISNVGLFRDKGMILELALGLVLFTVVGAGFLIHWMIPAIPLPVAFALAAIISPTDPVALSSITARAPVPKRLMHILEGESLLNDATGLVSFRFAVAAALTGGFSLASASMTFLWVAGIGLLMGVGFTLAATWTHRWLSRTFGEESGLPILLSLLLPFGAYLLAEWFGASGILAAVSAGITMSYVELSGRVLATTRLQRAAVWDMVQFALNGLVFVLLGEQLPGILRGAVVAAEQTGHANPWWLVFYALAITFVLAALRFLWVSISLRLTLFRSAERGQPAMKPSRRLVLVMSVAGVRGAITLAGVLTLPLLMPDGSPFPGRDLAIFLATMVILISLVLASVALPRLIEGLELPEEPAERIEEERARREAAAVAVAAVEKTQHEMLQDPADAEMYTRAATRVIAHYRDRMEGGAPTDVQAGKLRRSDELERVLRLAGLHAERERVFDLAREGQISDETSRKLVREIDLIESRYR